jgi:teichuronic acid biosynthesis glycosyltransferase TuaC
VYEADELTPINVLLISSLYPTPYQTNHGIFVHTFARHLVAKGCRVSVIRPIPWSPGVLSFNARWRQYGVVPATAEWDGIPTYYPRYIRPPGAWFIPWSGQTAWWGMRLLIEKLHGQHTFDLIHSHTAFPDGYAGCLAGERLNAPTVLTMHGGDFPGDLYPAGSLNHRRLRQVVSQTDQVIAVSQAMKQAIIELGPSKLSVRVIYLGVDTDEFRTLGAVETSRCALGLPPDPPIVLFVGWDIRRKGLRDLLLAFSGSEELAGVYLAVVGAAAEEVRSLAPGAYDALGSRLIVAGNRPHEEIPRWMNACDIFVLPSYLEGLPSVVVEAMACGKPVIASDVMGTPEVIHDGETGLLVKPGYPQELAVTIARLAHDPELSRRIGKQAQTFVRTRSSWHTHTDQVLEVYRNLLSEKGKAC